MIKILGHRGCMSPGFYENTLAAFTEALEFADGLETDAVRSKDGDVFLVHDTAFIEKVEYELARHLTDDSRHALAGRRLDQLSTAEARTLALKQDGALPELKTLLRIASKHPEAILNLELKGEDVADALVRTVRDAVRERFARPDQIIISSFNHGQLLQVRHIAPEFRLGLLLVLEEQPIGHRLHPWSQKDFGCYIPYRSEYLDDPLVKAINPDFINIEESVLRRENVAAIRSRFPQAKIMVWPFPLREPPPPEHTSLLQKLADPDIAPHIHSIITNYPREMARIVRKIS